MMSPDANVMKIEAELRAPVATVQLVHFQFPEPVSGLMHEDDAYLVNLGLTPRPRNARACYRDHWSPHRFERLGDIFLVPPREVVQARSDCGRQAAVICRLYPEPISLCFGADELEWTDQRLKATLDISDANIRFLLLRLAEEARHPGFASETLVELIVAQLGIELGRYCVGVTQAPVSGGLAPWRLRLIEERLKAVQEPPSLSELAKLCKLSVRQLTRGFRASRGYSIGDSIAHSRLEHAKRMLAGEQSIKAISYSLGFASPSSFSFAFRRAVGETPRQFRQRVLQGGFGRGQPAARALPEDLR